MLVCVGSIKGSPGATSTALALAATWPRPVTLIEADAVGGDLIYRCKPAMSSAPSDTANVLGLAASVRSGASIEDAVLTHAQSLQCGVAVVAGSSTSAQARGLVELWPTLAEACAAGEVDLVVDLGRLSSQSPVLSIAQTADVVLAVATTTLESVMHLDGALHDLIPALMRRRVVPVVPLLVGRDRYALDDRNDLDQVLDRSGHRVEPTRSLALDPKALARLERGESANGLLGRTILLRSARLLGEYLCSHRVAGLVTPTPASERETIVASTGRRSTRVGRVS